MPSPFPGMNPYLEQADVWHDFHERFMPMVAERLADQVDPRYIVKIDEHVFTAVCKTPAEGYVPAIDSERLAFIEIRDRR